ncbi:MAG: ankyrin repeat domain-containing protein [Calothrix sp. MO_192.B10]|nr:ankyrin repeat domain-containing protein [Calothrix sp. MO_192.B10]
MKIHTYVRQGNIAGVKQEIAHGVDVDCLDKYSSQTPLMCAVISPNCSVEMVQLLVENGANINAVGGEYKDDTILGLAVRSGNLDKVRYLLDAGADINYRKPHGYDVLIDAMFGRDISQDENLIPMLYLLISRGASVDGVSSYCESAIRVASRAGRFDAVKLLLAAGADANQLQWTELMYSIAFGSLEEIKTLLSAGADINVYDSWDRTPWLLSLQVGEVEKAKLLLSYGANRDDCGLCGKTPLMYAIENNHIEVLQWLIAEGYDVEATDEFGITPLMVAAECGATDCVRILLEAGANPSRSDNNCHQKAISEASNLEIVGMLVDAGEDLSDISDEMRQLLTKVGNSELQISPEQYLAGRYRRFGNSNPEVMEVDFWKAMVRSGVSAYFARDTFDDADNWDKAVWCYQRFGRTITELPDGRIIEIAGEHEDYYDPDFCIYNDVVVYQADGSFKILGYPKDIFPPTDFHSATLVGEYIYIIGSLGYNDAIIYNETPVYRLNYQSFKIEKVTTTGEKPGWISRHKAHYLKPSTIYITGGKLCVMVDDKDEYIDNLGDYTLDVTTLNWSRVN